jgi:hypothetical protein
MLAMASFAAVLADAHPAALLAAASYAVVLANARAAALLALSGLCSQMNTASVRLARTRLVVLADARPAAFLALASLAAVLAETIRSIRTVISLAAKSKSQPANTKVSRRSSGQKGQP